MKTKTLIAIAGVLMLALLIHPLLESKSTRTVNPPPTNRSGGPGDEGGSTTHRTCASTCHNTHGAAEIKAGWITSDIPVTGYVPGQTYNITVSISSPGVRYGFTASCQDTSGIYFGTLIANDSTSVTLDTVNNKSWIFQRDSTNAVANGLLHSIGYKGNSGFKTWTFGWKAPDAGSGTLIFYSSSVAGNGNASATDDSVFVSTLEVIEYKNTANLNSVKVKQIRLYPNPSNGNFQIDNLPLNATIEVFNLTGQSVYKTVNIESSLFISIPDLSNGIHYVKITNTENDSVIKFLINH